MKYETIKKDPMNWVQDIEDIDLQVREENKSDIFNKITSAGYNVNFEVEKLRQMYYGFIKNGYKG